MRLSARLALVFGAGSLLAVSSVALAAGYLARTEVVGGIDDSLRLRADRVITLVTSEPELVAGSGPTELLASFDDDGLGISAYRADGTLVAGRRDLADGELVAAAGPDGRSPVVAVTMDGRTFRLLAVGVEQVPAVSADDVSVLVLYEDVTAQEATLARLRRRLIGLALAAFAALAVAGWLIGRWLAAPLHRVTAAAEELARLDDLPARIEINRSDEVGRLADAFNRTLSALEVGREQQRRLVADASHELRTPLTSLRMRVEFLAGADGVPAAQREQMLTAATTDLERLSALVDELVDLAADTRSEEEDPVSTPLREVLEEVAGRSAAASLRSIEVEADHTVAVVRPGMIRRAVQNLVDNAVKYSPDDTPVTIRLEAGRIEVLDRGTGIAPEDRAQVFDRFYRSPRARSRPGSGIGLAIVKQVAELHGGEVWAGTAPDGGARVGFSVAT